jgi:serine/threonine protein kinase
VLFETSADFGVAKLLSNSSGASTFCGTPAYMAPELYLSYISKMKGQATHKYDYKCDVWSIGCMLLEMASRKDIDIFHYVAKKEGQDKGAVLGYNISQANAEESEEMLDSFILEYLPEEYEIVRRLLKSMLERHPEKRIDVKDILLDPVIRKRLENPPDSHWYDGLLQHTSHDQGTPV